VEHLLRMLPQQRRRLAHAPRGFREFDRNPDDLDFAGDGMLALDDHPTRLHLRMIDHLRGECDVSITRIDRLKTRQIADVDCPIVGFGPSRTVPTWPAVEVTELGVTAVELHLTGRTSKQMRAAIAGVGWTLEERQPIR